MVDPRLAPTRPAPASASVSTPGVAVSRLGTDLLEQGYRKTDRVLGAIVAAHFPVVLVVGLITGRWITALVVGGLISGVVAAVTRRRPGALGTRVLVGTGFMAYSALLIQLSGGLIEMHFHIFASLAFLLAYRDWRPIVVAAGFIAVHHVGFHLLQSAGAPVFVMPMADGAHDHGLMAGWGLIALHAAFVVMETAVLVWLSAGLAREAAESSDLLRAAEGLSRGELELSIENRGELGGTFARAVAALRTLVRDMGSVVEAVEAGDLSRRASEEGVQGAFREVARGLNRTVSALDQSQAKIRTDQARTDQFLADLGEVASALGQGDLTARVGAEHEGALGAMGQDLNRALDALGRTLAGVQSSSHEVTVASTEIGNANRRLSELSNHHADAISRISAEVEAMRVSVLEGVSRIDETHAAAFDTRDRSTQGAEAMGRLHEAIQDIAASSEETSKIVRSIDEIAFQTNLLALNAAVEAARAGDAGKGFAVVAEEVRALAMRSAEAARQTSHLIGSAADRARSGYAISGEALEALNQTLEGVARIADHVQAMATDATAQRSRAERMGDAVTHMERLTHEVAENASETAAATEEVSGQAREMLRQVEVFRVDAGSASGPSRNRLRSSGEGRRHDAERLAIR